MKTILFSLIFVSAIMFSSCTDCKQCKIVKTNTETGETLSESTPEEYCAEDLDATENEEPVVFGNEKSEWICQ